MQAITPDELSERLQASADSDYDDSVPERQPNVERVKRTNVGEVSLPESALAELELGPNNCAAE